MALLPVNGLIPSVRVIDGEFRLREEESCKDEVCAIRAHD